MVSTQCRSCLSHYQIRGGRVVVRKKTATRLTKPGEAPIVHPEAPVELAELSLPTLPKPSWLTRLMRPTKPRREILCFACDHEFTASGEAQSSQCPRCGRYVSLQDFHIDEAWNRGIQTRGNIVIGKRGSVFGVGLQCHHLTLLGKLSGAVECSGDMVIRSSGKIAGAIRCRTLRVERGARVEFLSTVHVQSAWMSGKVRGQFHCQGTITLAKRAELNGLVQAAALVAMPGAKHIGTIEILQPKSAIASHESTT